ncbi:MAG: FIST C-terminal domain-containing protein [Myxococcota bacterium]|nr:FIST C-terminal domain-containing protein [Deltaproteobacteria bacterium]MDQ3340648.1 FIST C-terminal domain-containing protein [Myxococcota bacterium]
MDIKTVSFDGKSWSGALPALDSDRTLVVVFGAPEYVDSQEPLQTIAKAYPRSQVVGCSSAGEICGSKVVDGSLVVAIAKFAHTSLACAFASASAADSHAAGQSIARELHKPSLRGILILSDGLNVNGSELVRGVNSVVGKDVVVTGGLAGDGSRFKQTWVLRDGKASGGVVSAVAFYGDRVMIGHGSKGGWDKFGPERTVTRSEGNVLFELDGEPALQLYKKYLGDRAQGLPATGLLFPLALRADAQDNKSLVRTILAVNEDKQSLTFAGDIPQGYLVQLMRANFDRLIGAAGDAALMTKQTAGSESKDTLAIAISCIGRRLVLGERVEEELETAIEMLPSGAQQVGFYSYGEISPYATGTCDLHNQTMTLTTISER